MKPLIKTRTGAYGVAVENNKILLITQEAGPYKGLLDLPGGGIELYESPLDALKREWVEEVSMHFLEAISFDQLAFTFEYDSGIFQHFGMIYFVSGLKELNGTKEHQCDWYEVVLLEDKQLTPFAKEVVRRLKKL
jgi:mutator protein MutT